MKNCTGKKGLGKGIAEELETIGEILKNCCCGLLCKLKKIRGTCISVSKSENNLKTESSKITVDINEEKVLITKIHAAFLELEHPIKLIDLAVITVKDKDEKVVFVDGFGDDITNIGIERYETTFVHPLLVKGPVTVTLEFFSPKPHLKPVPKLGALTVVYCKDHKDF